MWFILNENDIDRPLKAKENEYLTLWCVTDDDDGGNAAVIVWKRLNMNGG